MWPLKVSRRGWGLNAPALALPALIHERPRRGVLESLRIAPALLLLYCVKLLISLTGYSATLCRGPSYRWGSGPARGPDVPGSVGFVSRGR
jgi:hypothetical protein